MRIRKFQADSVREALLQVKEEMGSDALILRTQKIRGSILGGPDRYEVTAGLEDHFFDGEPVRDPTSTGTRAPVTRSGPAYGPGSRTATPTTSNPFFVQPPVSEPTGVRMPSGVREPTTAISREELQTLQQGLDAVRKAAESPKDELARVRREMGEIRSVLSVMADQWRDHSQVKVSEVFLPLFQQLMAADLSESFARRSCEEAQRRLGLEPGDSEWARNLLLQVLAECFPCAPVRVRQGQRRVLLFVGPTGVGKTTTIMKLAVKLSAQGGIKVGLLGCDNYRIGAPEQIKTFSEVAGIPLKLVFTEGELERALAELEDCDVVLVDTAGRSPRNQMHRLELNTLAERLQPHEVHLVQSSTTRLRDLRASVAAYKDIAPNRLVFTKLDETDSHGALCTLVADESIPVSLLCYGQEIPEHMGDASPEELARMVLGEDNVQSA